MGFVKHGQGEIVPGDEDVKKTASRDDNDRQERIQRLEEENEREDG